MKRKIVALFLVLFILVGTFPTVLGAPGDSKYANSEVYFYSDFASMVRSEVEAGTFTSLRTPVDVDNGTNVYFNPVGNASTASPVNYELDTKKIPGSTALHIWNDSTKPYTHAEKLAQYGAFGINAMLDESDEMHLSFDFAYTQSDVQAERVHRTVNLYAITEQLDVNDTAAKSSMGGIRFDVDGTLFINNQRVVDENGENFKMDNGKDPGAIHSIELVMIAGSRSAAGDPTPGTEGTYDIKKDNRYRLYYDGELIKQDYSKNSKLAVKGITGPQEERPLPIQINYGALHDQLLGIRNIRFEQSVNGTNEALNSNGAYSQKDFWIANVMLEGVSEGVGKKKATLSGNNITATENTELSGAEITVTLKNDSFNAISAGDITSAWNAVGLGDGLTARIEDVADGATEAKIIISGTPQKSQSSANVSFTIPSTVLKGGEAIETTGYVQCIINRQVGTMGDLLVENFENTDLRHWEIPDGVIGRTLNVTPVDFNDGTNTMKGNALKISRPAHLGGIPSVVLGRRFDRAENGSAVEVSFKLYSSNDNSNKSEADSLYVYFVSLDDATNADVSVGQILFDYGNGRISLNNSYKTNDTIDGVLKPKEVYDCKITYSYDAAGELTCKFVINGTEYTPETNYRNKGYINGFRIRANTASDIYISDLKVRGNTGNMYNLPKLPSVTSPSVSFVEGGGNEYAVGTYLKESHSFKQGGIAGANGEKSIIAWYQADNSNGDNCKFIGYNDNVSTGGFVIPPSAAGKYIKCIVYPKDKASSNANVAGEAVTALDWTKVKPATVTTLIDDDFSDLSSWTVTPDSAVGSKIKSRNDLSYNGLNKNGMEISLNESDAIGMSKIFETAEPNTVYELSINVLPTLNTTNAFIDFLSDGDPLISINPNFARDFSVYSGTSRVVGGPGMNPWDGIANIKATIVYDEQGKMRVSYNIFDRNMDFLPFTSYIKEGFIDELQLNFSALSQGYITDLKLVKIVNNEASAAPGFNVEGIYDQSGSDVAADGMFSATTSVKGSLDVSLAKQPVVMLVAQYDGNNRLLKLNISEPYTFNADSAQNAGDVLDTSEKKEMTVSLTVDERATKAKVMFMESLANLKPLDCKEVEISSGVFKFADIPYEAQFWPNYSNLYPLTWSDLADMHWEGDLDEFSVNQAGDYLFSSTDGDMFPNLYTFYDTVDYYCSKTDFTDAGVTAYLYVMYQDDDNNYKVEITSGNMRLIKTVDGVETVLGEKAVNMFNAGNPGIRIQRDKNGHMTVCVCNSYKLDRTVTDMPQNAKELVFSVDDTSLTYGKIGFGYTNTSDTTTNGVAGICARGNMSENPVKLTVPAPRPVSEPSFTSYDPKNSANVRYLGRAITYDNSVFTGWPFAGIEFNVTNAEAVYVQLQDIGNVAAVYGISIDDKPYERVNLQFFNSAGWLKIAEFASPGTHKIRFVQLNDINSRAKIKDLKVSGSNVVVAPSAASERKIEFVGDSITAGYAALLHAEGSLNIDYGDAGINYAGLTAEHFGAEASIVAIGGGGLKRPEDDYNTYKYYLNSGFKSKMPSDFPDWDFTKFSPDIIVVNVGTNGANHTKEDYINFYNEIREQYGNDDAVILFALGAMWNYAGNAWQAIEPAVADINKSGDSKVYCTQIGDRMTNGNAQHPDVYQHRVMADLLIDKIEEIMGW